MQEGSTRGRRGGLMVEDSNGGGRRGRGEIGRERGKMNKDVTRFLLGVGRCYCGEWRRNLLWVWFYGGFRGRCYMNNICHGREGGVPPPVRVEQWGPYHPFSKFFLFFPRGWVVNDL